jgi:hypothetical protein
MLGVLRMLATAEMVMKHIVSQVMVLADGIALAFADDAAALTAASVLAIGPSVLDAPSPAGAGDIHPIPLAGRVPSGLTAPPERGRKSVTIW